MLTRIQLNHESAEIWKQSDPVLGLAEVGFEVDTRRWKIGDGSTNWNGLGYSIEALFSNTEKVKLYTIEDNAQRNPPRVEQQELDNVEFNESRSYAPKDIYQMICAAIAFEVGVDGGNAPDDVTLTIDAGLLESMSIEESPSLTLNGGCACA